MPSYKDYESFGSSTGDFYRLESGDNKIRILSEFEVISKHFMPDKTVSLCRGDKNGCTLCRQGNKPSTKFLMWILDRKDMQIKVAELGYSIIKQLGELAKSADWHFDDIPNYDINVKRTGEGMNTEYFVSPCKPNELPEDVLAVFSEKDIISKIADKIREKGGVSNTIQVESDVENITF